MKYILGITGGSGVGKTTVSNILRKKGIEIIDGDKVSRLIMEPGKEALAETVAAFGTDILDAEGNLKRRELGRIVFSDSKKLEILNKITHKYITKYFFDRLENSDAEIIGFDGAALFESGMNRLCDAVLGVIADTDIRVSRIVMRDEISIDDAKKRINSQKNNEFYIEKCEFLVYNNGNEKELEVQIEGVLEKLVQQRKEKREKTDS